MARVLMTEVKRWLTDCLIAVKTPAPHVGSMVDMLLAAERRGHASHGLHRLQQYICDIKNKVINPCSAPVLLKETASSALVDGKNGLGPLVATYSMQIAIKKAKEHGVGWVTARQSNHYGMSSYYSMKAAEEGLIGFVCSNGAPLVCPTRSKVAALGTNPLSFAAPGPNGNMFVLDMSTSVVSVGKVEMKKKKGEKLPEGWALLNGKPSTEAEQALSSGCLVPLGGDEEHGGHKGTGLAMMVDILAGVLSGSGYATLIKKYGSTSNEPSNLGHCFVALSPSNFCDGFVERLGNFMQLIKCLPPAVEGCPVLLPGDKEKEAEDKNSQCLTFPCEVLEGYQKIGDSLEVKRMETIKE